MNCEECRRVCERECVCVCVWFVERKGKQCDSGVAKRRRISEDAEEEEADDEEEVAKPLGF